MAYFLIVLFVLIAGGVFLWFVCESHHERDGDAILQSLIGLVVHVGPNILIALILLLDRNFKPAVYAHGADEDPRPWLVFASIVIFIVAVKIAGPPTKEKDSDEQTK